MREVQIPLLATARTSGRQSSLKEVNSGFDRSVYLKLALFHAHI